MRVLGKYVIVEELKEDIQETQGGLLLAQNHRDDLRYRKATVIRSGELVDTVVEHDSIMFDGNAGYVLPYPLDKYKVIREHDIIVVE